MILLLKIVYICSSNMSEFNVMMLSSIIFIYCGGILRLLQCQTGLDKNS